MRDSADSIADQVRSPKTWSIVLILLAAMGMSYGIGRWDVSRLARSSKEQIVRIQSDAFQAIQDEVTATFESMQVQARAIAGSAAVIEGLRSRSSRPGGSERVTRAVSKIKIEEREFLEIYDQAPSLTVWKGPVFPMDSAVLRPEFLSSTQESVVLDESIRTAFVVWSPVMDAGKILGAVRFGKLVENHMPLKNEYLRDYTWGEEWSRRLAVNVEFEFGEDVSAHSSGERILTSPLGMTVGKVVIDFSTGARLARTRSERYTDVTAFWLLLICVWLAVRFTNVLWQYEQDGTDNHCAKNERYRYQWLVSYLVFLVVIRWIFLLADIPARWQTGKAPLAPLFDPQHLALVYGLGALRTIGDMFITAVFITLASLVILRVTASLRQRTLDKIHFDSQNKLSPRLGWALLAYLILVLGLSWILFELSSHAILDSTLDYFARSGLLPERLVLLVFSALLLIVFSMVLMGGRLLWLVLVLVQVDTSKLPGKPVVISLIAVLALFVSFASWSLGSDIPVHIYLLIVVAVLITALLGPIQPAHNSPIVALRRIAPIVVVTSILLYPMLEVSSDRKIELRMRDAGESFLEEKNARVMFAISQVLEAATTPGFEAEVDRLGQLAPAKQRARFDSLSEASTRGLLLWALAGFNIAITIHDLQGEVLGRYSNLNRRMPRSLRDASDRSEFDLFKAMYTEFGSVGPMIEKLTGTADQNRFRYAGFKADRLPGRYYVLVRAEQRSLTEAASTPFPKVLSPASYYGNRYSDVSVAEFRNGVLIRSKGSSFGRARLGDNIMARLQRSSEVWVKERVRDRTYQTFYRAPASLNTGLESSVIAVRRRISNTFDQLYNLLRIVVAGLFLAAPVYLTGLFWRIRRPELRTRSRRFRDKVLNAFFSVGIVTVLVTGFLGISVVTSENERTIESWLRQHLDRVEEILQLEATGEELPYRVLDRISVDSLAAQVGLDLIIYQGVEVDQSSRPELIRDRLIEKRLPIEAYEALFYDGFRFVTVQEKIGTFSYTAGYRAITDERGAPHYVVSIPTLPEQERIEEERARTVAYLFGALLLLVLVVMVTASLLANALTRPFAQLRAGLRSVAAGHFERIPKVETGDELADLVDSFNTMQDQLEESQRLLGQQERQLAWKEMARQVAHEIKNPLTPMKLSIQHLRSAFDRERGGGDAEDKFSMKFKQTTTTLIEQIDTLARIANEFSSFSRMPKHIEENVDLNAVIREAVGLMQAEDNVLITTDLADETLTVNGDREALRRVYVNFLKNAIQAVPGDRKAIIEVTTRKEKGREGQYSVLSRVSDNGSGIPRNLWEKIFVPSFSTKTSGTGLGLAIARKTIENIDGEIGFDTKDGFGSTFWIRVPLVRVPD